MHQVEINIQPEFKVRPHVDGAFVELVVDAIRSDHPDVYTESKRKALLDEHKQIARDPKYKVVKPYFDFTKPKDRQTESQFFLNAQRSSFTFEGHDFVIQYMIGQVEQFDAEDLAPIIKEQTDEYIAKDTMGDFPKDDQEKRRELTGSMIGSFSPHDLIITFQLQSKEKKGSRPVLMKPISGAKLIFSDSGTPLREANGSALSAIPTLSALRIKDFTKLGDVPSDFIETPESAFVCASRLFNEGVEAIPETQNPLNPFFVATYTGLAAHYYSLKGLRSAPKWLIYDTHKARLVDMLANFGGRILAFNGNVEATEHIRRTILGHHYNLDLDMQLQIGVIPMDQFLQMAIQFMKKYDLPVPEPFKGMV